MFLPFLFLSAKDSPPQILVGSLFFFFFLRLSPKDSPLQIVVGSLFFFFLSESKSKRLPTADYKWGVWGFFFL